MKNVSDWFKSWKLVSWRSAVVVAIVVYGLVGFLVVPRIAKNLIIKMVHERTGREVTVGEVRCNPFALSLTIRDFSFPDRPGSTMLSFDEFYANAQVSSLFRWAATLKEFRLDNPYIGIRRFADGGINVLELMDDIEERTPPETEPKEESGLPRALLQHILVTGSSIDIEDLARAEPLLWELGPARFELHDISTIPDRKGANDFVIGLPRGGTIKINGDVAVEPLGLTGNVNVDDVYLVRAWEALAPFFEFDVVDGVARGGFSYSVFLAEDGPHAEISEANSVVTGIEITGGTNNETLLKVGSVTISDVSITYPEARVRGSSIIVEGAEAFQWIRPDGTPSWDKLVPKETQEKTVEIYREVEEAFPWDIALDRFEIKDAIARVEDRTFPEPLQLVVEDANLALTEIVTGPGHQWGLTASAKLMREGTAKLDGFVGTGPMRVEAEVAMENLQIASFQPYVERMAPIELRSGSIATKGTAKASGGGVEPAASFAGGLTIADFEVGESLLGTTPLKWDRVETGGIKAGVAPMLLEIATIDIFDAGVEIVMSEDGKINVLGVLAAMTEDAETAGGAGTDEAEKTTLPPLSVGTITFHGCSGALTDRSLSPAFSLALAAVDGTISGLTNTKVVGAELDIEGTVKSGGTVSVTGEMDLLDPKRLTDLEIDVREAILPPNSPMAIRYIGHPIDDGTVNLGFDYEIVNSELAGTNTIVTQDLALGDKVEGEGKVNLPFKLGVSLLTDKEGRITLEFPIEGNLDSPGFVIADAIGSAATEIVSEVIKSPLRLLGKLGGGSGDEDFRFVEFKAGSAILENSATGKLRTLAAGVDQRPELVLVIEGAWDAETDAFGLKEAAFEARIADLEVSREVFESMYLETASSDNLDALHAQNMTTDASTGEQVFDETSYYHALRKALIEAQPVDQSAIAALADARAEAVRACLVDDQGIDPARVRVTNPVAIKESSDDGWVRCRLDVDTSG